MTTYDHLIKNGRVIDAANNIDATLDLAITSGKIAAVEADLDSSQAQQVYDATGKLVVPGLIDIHMHGYNHVTPLGIDTDSYCLGRGVTTAVDAGSAGGHTYPGFRVYAVEPAVTRLLGFLNISLAGLAVGGKSDGTTAGELDGRAFINAPTCIETIEANRDIFVGVKVRLSRSIAEDGKNEPEAYRAALEAAAAVKLPLMVHHAFSVVPMDECPGKMVAGDIYTHCYHGFESTIVDAGTRKMNASVVDARERGVIFDIGHGTGAFNWTVAEICASEEFWPDVISTDLHSLTCEGPGYDMPTVMSKLLHLGMPLPELIEASTLSAAEAIGWEDRIGTLGIGREADVAVLSLDDVDVELEDCQGQMRRIEQRLSASAVWRAGEPGKITHPLKWPNPEKLEDLRSFIPMLKISDQG
jgi:dihydroorotase